MATVGIFGKMKWLWKMLHYIIYYMYQYTLPRNRFALNYDHSLGIKFVEMLKFKYLWALEKQWQFWILFNLETLKFYLRLDSNAGPSATQSDHLTTIPNFLRENFWKNFRRNFKRYFQSFCSRVASWIEEQSAISFEKTKNKNY